MRSLILATEASKAPSRRRTQAERTSDTRARIIEAAITCLHEKGYANTTTIAVVEQAGLSRGAMLHHFGMKTDLIRAVVDHVFAANRAFYADRLGRIADPRARLLAVIDLIWELAQTQSFMAVMEICMATRNDPELGDLFRKVRKKEEDTTRQELLKVAVDAGVADLARLRAFESLINCAFAGMAVFAAIHGGFDPLKGVVGELRRAAESLLPPQPRADRGGALRPAKAAARAKPRPRTAVGAAPPPATRG